MDRFIASFVCLSWSPTLF